MSNQVNAAGNTTESTVGRGLGYFRASVDELKKISHPTRQEATQLTIATLFIICFIAICLMALDMIFKQLMVALLG